jgi:nucleoside-diphosphate-sugar epimerase
MVVGNGMIARSFSAYTNREDVVIYASGVSNSAENSEDKFQREIDLIKTCIEKNVNCLIVYFSTCSISDKSLIDTRYVQHKIFIEDYIKKHASSFIIFRLPIVIGKTDNKFTLFNFFQEKLSKNQELFIQKNAYRYLVDVDDVSSVLSQIIDSKNFLNYTIEVVFSERISVLEMVDVMKKAISSDSKINLVDGGGSYVVDNSFVERFIYSSKIAISKEYNKEVLKKYLKEKSQYD